MRVCRFVVFLLALVAAGASPSLAQSAGNRAIILENTPIMLLPDAGRTPLRIAAKGSALTLLSDEGAWLQVQFQDPQFGLRIGYVQSKFARKEVTALQPIDLSIRAEPRAATGTTEVGVSSPAATSAQQIATPMSPARPALLRSGFWLSGGLGFGSLGCDTCGDGRANGGSGGLAAGGTISDRLLLGAGTTGWYRSEDGVWVSASTFDARVRFYPSRYSGFFVNGGFGLGSVSLGVGSLSISETGVGAMLGLGWDLRVGRNVSLTPFWNGSGISTSSLNVNFGQVGLGVTVH